MLLTIRTIGQNTHAHKAKIVYEIACFFPFFFLISKISELLRNIHSTSMNVERGLAF